MQIGFLLLMHTALGSQGEGVHGSGTVGREGGVLIVAILSKQLKLMHTTLEKVHRLAQKV